MRNNSCVRKPLQIGGGERIGEMGQVLVAYFSASGVTKKVAERLAGVVGADLYEIVPEQPYTKADLNWMNKKSRSSVEMADRSCRPAIAGRVDDISRYTHVFVGFPVWWYREPSIIDTFMESYDFNNITVIPFCTSGMSGIGDSAANMQALAKGGKVLEGKRFPARVAEEKIMEWVMDVMGDACFDAG